MRSGRWGSLVIAALLIAGCSQAGETVNPSDSESSKYPASEKTDSATSSSCPGEPANLVNDQYPPAAAGDEGWDYHRQLTADFDGDGADETAHLISYVEETSSGEYAWDDSQPWHVYVQEADGERTYLYSASVQLGMLEVATDPAEKGLRLFMHANGGSYFGLACAEYHGPGTTRTTHVVEHAVLDRIV